VPNVDSWGGRDKPFSSALPTAREGSDRRMLDSVGAALHIALEASA
jgi:hypothetical protein